MNCKSKEIFFSKYPWTLSNSISTSPLSEKNLCKITAQSPSQNTYRLSTEPFEMHLFKKANFLLPMGELNSVSYSWTNFLASQSQTPRGEWTTHCETEQPLKFKLLIIWQMILITGEDGVKTLWSTMAKNPTTGDSINAAYSNIWKSYLAKPWTDSNPIGWIKYKI